MIKRCLFVVIFICFSCNNERIIELPEIKKSEVTEVLDVSPAYIFYDETQLDSTLFNRKNLISTTNWLVNVDKRLTLKQVIPHLQYLQQKRQKASMHKNENAKNYFTCNDTSIKNLGFLEFTEINFNDEVNKIKTNESLCIMTVNSITEIVFSTSIDLNISFSRESFISALNIARKEYGDEVKIVLHFNSAISFQDYITIKSELKPFEDSISNNEFIY